MGWVYLGIGIAVTLAFIGAVGGVLMDEGCMTVIFGALFGGILGFVVSMVPISYGQAHYNERVMV